MTITVRNKKAELCYFGVYNMFNNKFDQNRPKVCSETEKQFNFKDITFIWHMAKSNFFYWAQNIFDLFSYFRTFSNIFQNILTPLFRTYVGRPRKVGPRNKRGCFQHPTKLVPARYFVKASNCHGDYFDHSTIFFQSVQFH